MQFDADYSGLMNALAHDEDFRTSFEQPPSAALARFGIQVEASSAVAPAPAAILAKGRELELDRSGLAPMAVVIFSR